MSEDGDVRRELRDFFAKRARITSTVIKKRRDEASKYQDYFDLERTGGSEHHLTGFWLRLRGGNEGIQRSTPSRKSRLR